MTNRPILFFKAHIPTYTKKSGAVVPAHQDKRQAGAKPAPKAGEVPDKHYDLMEDSLANDEDGSDDELHEHFVKEGVHPDHAREALKHRDAFLQTAIPPKGMLRDLMSKKK